MNTKINIPRKIFLPIIVLLMIGFVVLDQLVKKIAISLLSASPSHSFMRWLAPPFHFSDYFGFEIYKNYGIAFGLPISAAVFYFLVFLFFVWLASGKLLSFGEMGKKEIFAVALILSGAFGNLIDRVRFGYIIDYVNLGDIVIFNLADVMIAAGAMILLKSFFQKNR